MAFKAASYDDITFELELQSEGSGTPSSTHAEEAHKQDADGVYQVFPAGEPIWKGARCVLDGAAGTDVDAAYADNGFGTLLGPQPYLSNHPAYKQHMQYSRFESTNSGLSYNFDVWERGNSCTIARDQVGIDGVANTATTITWGSSNSIIQQCQWVDTGYTATFIVWFKKTTSATTYPSIGMVRSGGTTVASQSAEYIFNTDDGTYTGRTGYFDASTSSVKAVLENNGFWRVTLHHNYLVPDSSKQYVPRILPSAALASAPTTWDVSNSGSCIVGQTQLALNKEVATSDIVGPVFNSTSSTKTLTASKSTWDSANHNNTEGGYYVEIDYQGDDVNILSITTEVSSHVYWRIYTTATGDNSIYTTIAEIEMRATSGGADQCNGGTASASTVYTIYSASNAFDNASNTFWHGDGALPQWIEYQFASAVSVAEFTIQSRSINPSRTPTEFLLQYSDNGDDWTTQKSFVTPATWAGSEIRTFTAGNVESILYTESNLLNLDDGTTKISTAITTGEHQIGIAWETDTSEMELCLDGTWYGTAPSYLLNASFTAANQTFTDAQVLDTSAEGVETGSLTAVDTSTGTVKIVSNQLEMIGNGTGPDTGIKETTGITKSIGLAWFVSAENSVTNSYGVFPRWGDASGLAYSNRVYQFAFNNNGTLVAEGYSPAGTNSHALYTFNYSANTQYELSVVCGGYNSSGEAYASGDTKADFAYGACFFRNDGTNWLLEYRETRDNASPVYFGNIQHSTATSLTDYCNVLDVDYSPILTPVVLDTFTDTDSTAITSHTPDVDTEGGGWANYQIDSVSVASPTISSNRYYINTDATYVISAIDSGKADVYMEAIVNGSSSQLAIFARHTRVASKTYGWLARVHVQDDLIEVIERNNGSNTSRASAAATLSDSTDYRLVMICDGQTITASIMGEAQCSYASASLNETETEHGVTSWASTGGKVDNFAIFARGNSGEYNDLGTEL